MRAAGIVLAGGRSTRMQRDKSALPWGGSTLLAVVCSTLTRAVDGPVVVVRAAEQELPELPGGVEVVDDPAPDRGPVQGLAAGLRTVAGRAEVAFAAATDLPLLHEAVVRLILLELVSHPECDVAVPELGGHPQLLAAAYRPAVADAFEAALLGDERRLRTVVSALPVRRLAAADLLADAAVADADPNLESFTNLNDPQEYARARDARRG